MSSAAKLSGQALDFFNHWSWAAIEFALTYTWPLLILGACVWAWRGFKNR